MQAVGFSASLDEDGIDQENLLKYITPSDLKSFGLIPEIIGRLPVLTFMNPLDAKALRAILTEPKNSIIKQYQKLFAMDDVDFTIAEEALNFIVDKAILLKLGARGLRSICEAILTESMYNAPENDSKELVVDLSYAEKQFSKSKISQLKVA